MKGFKNSSKTQYSAGGCDGYAKGGSVRGAAKVGKVMREFKSGELHSGSKKGPLVTNPKQAVAIAMHEGKVPMKKRSGGAVREGVSTRPTTASGRRATDEELMRDSALGAAVARGNRSQAREAREEAALIAEGRRAARAMSRNPYTSEDRPSRGYSHGGLAAVMPKKGK